MGTTEQSAGFFIFKHFCKANLKGGNKYVFFWKERRRQSAGLRQLEQLRGSYLGRIDGWQSAQKSSQESKCVPLRIHANMFFEKESNALQNLQQRGHRCSSFNWIVGSGLTLASSLDGSGLRKAAKNTCLFAVPLIA